VSAGVARVRAQVRRTVAVASRDLRRGDVLDAESFTSDARWLSPGARPAAIDALEGTSVRTRIRAGQVIASPDVEQPLAIRRGDVVFVHAVSGSMALKRLSRALADGKVGDVVPFEPADAPASRRGKPAREPYRARVSAPGLAVIVDPSEGAAP